MLRVRIRHELELLSSSSDRQTEQNSKTYSPLSRPIRSSPACNIFIPGSLKIGRVTRNERRRKLTSVRPRLFVRSLHALPSLALIPSYLRQFFALASFLSKLVLAAADVEAAFVHLARSCLIDRPPSSKLKYCLGLS